LFKQGHVPTLFQTDNGSEFQKNTKAILKKYNIKHITSKPRCPQTQGMVENFNRYVKKYISLAFLTENRAHFNLKEKIDEIVEGYNNRTHCATKFAP